MKNNKGFSLVELIVVIAIMAILAAVAIPTFASFITKANVATDVDFLNNAEYAAELAYTADPSKEIACVFVTLNDGDVASVTVNFVQPAGENVTPIASVVVTEGDKDDTDEAKSMIANTIDWNYTFKSEKTGDWTVDGKVLADAPDPVTGSTNTDNTNTDNTDNQG